jgi:predicted O-methyltransferase YrrM
MSQGFIRPSVKRLLALAGLRLVRLEREAAPRREPSPAEPSRPLPQPAMHPSLAFAPPGHFYSPIPDLAEVERKSSLLFSTAPRDLPGIDLRERRQLELLEQCVDFYREQPFTAARTEANRYFFENPAYSYSDAIFYYLMLRRFRPRRLIEVGSGYSTCIALDTNERFLNGSLEITCIEPYPELVRSLIRPSDAERVTIRAEPLQDVPLSLFESLGENDILFVDSTHVSRIGSDVNRLFFEVLPSLRPGVLIHIHDVFYPFEYPRHWILEGRAWNEIYVLRAFLEFNDGFEIVLFNTFLTQNRRDFVQERFPLCLANEGGSLWLRRVR